MEVIKNPFEKHLEEIPKNNWVTKNNEVIIDLLEVQLRNDFEDVNDEVQNEKTAAAFQQKSPFSKSQLEQLQLVNTAESNDEDTSLQEQNKMQDSLTSILKKKKDLNQKNHGMDENIAADNENQMNIKNTYGYIWSVWLFHNDKDRFMIDVYNLCKTIDECVDPNKKNILLAMLKEKVHLSKKSWVEGIEDFIDFESTTISSGKVPLDIFADNEDYQALAIIDGAYRHGAFRGLCRTASGAEWICLMGEWCAAALHQGLKWMRLKKPVSDWELPSLGEDWCKGIAIWALVCFYMIIDQAGDNPDNDKIIMRIHTVIGAHHMAGVCWLQYRGEHPHRWFSPKIRGVAPCQKAIRRFGEKHAYPTIMVDIMCQAATHVNEWINPPFHPVHFARTRGLLIWKHTPRLQTRLDKLCDELIKLAGDMTPTEVEEFKWRSSSWMCSYTTHWRGRGDLKDILLELTLPGALVGVLRESRPGVTSELADKMVEWSRDHIHLLPNEDQDTILSTVRTHIEIRGRIPGTVEGYSSAGVGHTRWMDGTWDLTVLLVDLVSPSRPKKISPELKSLIIRFFSAVKTCRQVEGVDVPYGDDNSNKCHLCLPKSIFTALVDNRLSTAIMHSTIWGSLLYNNLGFGLPNDASMGCES